MEKKAVPFLYNYSVFGLVAGCKRAADWWIDDGFGGRKVPITLSHCAQNFAALRHKTSTVSFRVEICFVFFDMVTYLLVFECL